MTPSALMRLSTPTRDQATLLAPHLNATHAVLDGGSLVGGLGVSPVRPGTSSLAFWVLPSARRHGVATEAVRALCRQADSRLELVTEITDTVSQRVALAAGFTRESVRRGAVWHDGRRRDDVVWAWLPGDPPGPVARPLPDLPDGVLRDGEVTLRPWCLADVDDLLGLLTLPDVMARAVYRRDLTRAYLERRCAAAASEWLAGERAGFTMRVNDEFAGDIGLSNEVFSGQATIGYSTLPAYRGRGVTTRAVRLLSTWAFEIGIRRLVAGTAPGNAGSQRVLAKAGFVHEAIQRSRFDGPDGERVDDFVHVLLPPPG